VKGEIPLSPVRGPRTEDLIIHFYENISRAYDALKDGEIDILGYEISGELYDDAVGDPNIVLGRWAGSGMTEFDINNNCTVPSYPGVRSPTNYQGFRQALALLVDKEHIVESICDSFAERIDQPISAVNRGWRNTSMWDPNYPYEYDPQLAAATLDAAGFLQGPTVNPYYDAAYPGSAQFIRTYPILHSKAGQDLDPLKYCIRTEDPRRYHAGNLHRDNLRKHGIPINTIHGPSSQLYPIVMDNLDYHLYTGIWSLGGLPPFNLIRFHSSEWGPFGGNYLTGLDCTGQPNYPKLDQLIENALGALTHDDAVMYTREALGYFTEQCIIIPLFSAASYWPWSRNVLGIVNMEGFGPESWLSFMNAYKMDASPLRYGLISPPNMMNIIYEDTYNDWQALNKMNLYVKIEEAPYDLSVRQAGWIQDWSVDTWDNEGETKTKLSLWFKPGAHFAEPVTGNQKAELNATHYFFSAWYIIQTPPAWWGGEFADIDHINIVDTYHVEVCYDTLSYWHTYDATCPMLPIDTWTQQPELVGQTIETFIEGTNLTTPGLPDLGGLPVWIQNLTVDGTPLEMFSDYNIVEHCPLTYDVEGRLEIFTNLTEGATIVVDYFYIEDPIGYTPGDVAWETILEGAGMYYATDFTPGMNLTLKRNPYYWMETPLLGEIDFLWNFEAGPHPRSGHYTINLYDVVTAANAYGSQGVWDPDKNWFPGVDTAPVSGQIDIFDIVTTCSKYGQIWGQS